MRLHNEDNIGMYLRETDWECADWMYLAEHRDRWWAVTYICTYHEFTSL